MWIFFIYSSIFSKQTLDLNYCHLKEAFIVDVNIEIWNCRNILGIVSKRVEWTEKLLAYLDDSFWHLKKILQRLVFSTDEKRQNVDKLTEKTKSSINKIV